MWMIDKWNSLVEGFTGSSVVKTVFDHNRYTTLGLALALTLGGCTEWFQPHTKSPVSDKQVTRSQLETEMQTWLVGFKLKQDALVAEGKDAEIKFSASIKDLDEKQAMYQQVFDAVNVTLGTVAGPYGGWVSLALGLFAAGTKLDNRRKDTVNEIQKNEISDLKAKLAAVITDDTNVNITPSNT